jgi:lysylphosphatidylglycerol synthetase-like protein (DUF2156 family)
MMLATRTDGASTRRFAVWGIAPWIMLLLAALGCLQYLQHAEYVSLVAACAVIVICGGCILRQSWARSGMRVLAVLLALWALITAILMLQQWDAFERARQHAMAQPQLGDLALWIINRAQRTWQVGLALKLVAIPLLLWLAWQLGRPQVRAQFHPLRRGSQQSRPVR